MVQFKLVVLFSLRDSVSVVAYCCHPAIVLLSSPKDLKEILEKVIRILVLHV